MYSFEMLPPDVPVHLGTRTEPMVLLQMTHCLLLLVAFAGGPSVPRLWYLTPTLLRSFFSGGVVAT